MSLHDPIADTPLFAPSVPSDVPPTHQQQAADIEALQTYLRQVATGERAAEPEAKIRLYHRDTQLDLERIRSAIHHPQDMGSLRQRLLLQIEAVLHTLDISHLVVDYLDPHERVRISFPVPVTPQPSAGAMAAEDILAELQDMRGLALTLRDTAPLEASGTITRFKAFVGKEILPRIDAAIDEQQRNMVAEQEHIEAKLAGTGEDADSVRAYLGRIATPAKGQGTGK